MCAPPAFDCLFHPQRFTGGWLPSELRYDCAMNPRAAGPLRIIFAFVIVFLAGIFGISVRMILHSQSDRLAEIAFLVAATCLVLVFEKAFPSVYSSHRRPRPWWQTRAIVPVVAIVLGSVISILSSRIATVWFGLLIISGTFGALLLRAKRRDGEL